MACEITCCQSAVFALWGEPTTEDMDRVADALRQTAAKVGHPVAYVARVPADAPAPDARVRRHLDTLMPEIVDTCSTYHVILEGDGFLSAMKRAVLLGLFQIRWRHGVFFVHSNVAELLSHVPPGDSAAVAQVVELARRKGHVPGVAAPKSQSASRHSA